MYVKLYTAGRLGDYADVLAALGQFYGWKSWLSAAADSPPALHFWRCTFEHMQSFSPTTPQTHLPKVSIFWG